MIGNTRCVMQIHTNKAPTNNGKLPLFLVTLFLRVGHGDSHRGPAVPKANGLVMVITVVTLRLILGLALNAHARTSAVMVIRLVLMLILGLAL